jgi:hypothetical protein
MTLTAGSRLGPYEIVSPLGAGGMRPHDVVRRLPAGPYEIAAPLGGGHHPDGGVEK